MFKRNIIRYIVMAATVLLFAMGMESCGSSKGHTAKAVYRTSRSASGKSAGDVFKRRVNLSAAPTPSGRALLKEADSWIGTPYIYGGNDRKGVDCSGFVLQVYLNALNIKLPRTSLKQHEYCSPLGRNELEPGDLVFFTVRGGGSVGHVGIYIGAGEMVHASTSKGVIVSSLSDNYYQTNYYSSGRVARYGALLAAERSSQGGKGGGRTKSGAVAEESLAASAPAQSRRDIKVTRVTPPPATRAALASGGGGTSPAAAASSLPAVEPEPDMVVMTDFFD